MVCKKRRLNSGFSRLLRWAIMDWNTICEESAITTVPTAVLFISYSYVKKVVRYIFRVYHVQCLSWGTTRLSENGEVNIFPDIIWSRMGPTTSLLLLRTTKKKQKRLKGCISKWATLWFIAIAKMLGNSSRRKLRNMCVVMSWLNRSHTCRKTWNTSLTIILMLIKIISTDITTESTKVFWRKGRCQLFGM